MFKIGQVWIETVLYTIVGLAIIGIVLGFAMPKITESRDNLAVEQSVNAMKSLDSQIRETARSSGNIRSPDFILKRGFLEINGQDNKISLTIDDLKSLYSEDNSSFNDGNVNILSLKGSKKNTVILTLSYDYNITYEGIDQNKKVSSASTSYKITILNNNTNIDLKVD